MKRNRTSSSAHINVRVLLALTLCLTGMSLAVSALGAWPPLLLQAWNAAQRQAALAEKTKMKHEAAEASHGPLRSIAMKRNASSGATTSGAAAPGQSGAASPATVAARTNAAGQTVYSISPSNFDTSPPLSELAKISVPKKAAKPRPELPLPPSRTLRSGRPDPVTQVAPASKGSVKGPSSPTTAATGFNFDGMKGNVLTSGYPPDTNGSVGNDQYVEMVNTQYQVWSLDRTTNTATSVLGPVNINTLWAGFGGACETQDSGDPVVLYDKVANRWLLSQFTSSADANGIYYQCVALSSSADAKGTYARYAFAVPNNDFGDYPKYGAWSDAYYVMDHNFTPDSSGNLSFHAACFGAMDRTKMLAADPAATWQVILDPSEGGHLPADLDGFAPPPTGAPGIFASVHPDGMYLYRMKVDFANPANTIKTLQAKMPIAPASAACGGGNCIPQPNSPVTLDSLADRLMFRLAYRNYVDHESLVVNHSVDPGVAGVVSGVRWYEFRISGQPNDVCSTYPCTYQQGTIADQPNGRSRWMGSIAEDGSENMIVGYSTTGTLEATDAHSIRYTGRAKDHPLGTMTVPETIIFTGNRNEVAENTLRTLPGRWGDYTSTSIDPADDCTFWHANEYYQQGNGGNTNFDWSTRIASSSFAAVQCQPSSCTSRPATAPAIGGASAIAPNQIQVTWTAVTPAPGSYAIERANGAAGSEGLYQPLAFVSGSSTSFTDTTVQGGLTYTYRVIAATDPRGRCQALVHSDPASATATGTCTLKPVFAGAASATSVDGPICGVTVSWSPATPNCPLKQIKYDVYRGTTPDFVPSASNRIANCISGPSSYTDTSALNSGNTYYYVVHAEDNSTGNGGTCGGNEENNNVVVAGTAYGPGTQPTPGTWTDGGGDLTSFLRLNVDDNGGPASPDWRIVTTADDPGANHTQGGAYAYRNAGPGPDNIYGDLHCSAAETPLLTVAGTSVNLTYWERHQFEKGWDGVAIEYSRNGGAWTDLPAPSNATADGCMSSDVTGDYAPLECTGDPPINACAFPADKPVITGPNNLPAGNCTTYMTGNLTDYGRRCHLLTGLTPGDTIKFRWKFSSDPATTFRGFYLDDIAVTNVNLPNFCTAGPSATPMPTPTATIPGPTATPSASTTPSPTATATGTASPSATSSPTPALASQALNLSTRLPVDVGDNAGIGGFIITGNVPKHVLIRAIGPSLTKSGFSSADVLADPTLELHGEGSFATVSNDNWRDSQEAEIKADGLPPTDDLESAIDATLAPGSYTAIVRGNGTGKGIALVEIYDLDPAADSKLANLSTRGFVATGNGVVIAGFILGNNSGDDRVIVRGLGPSLSSAGVANPLQDPTLELRDENGALLLADDDWQDDPAQAAEVSAAGLAPAKTKESAISTTLPPGHYTAILAGLNNDTGVGLVEVYDRGMP